MTIVETMICWRWTTKMAVHWGEQEPGKVLTRKCAQHWRCFKELRASGIKAALCFASRSSSSLLPLDKSYPSDPVMLVYHIVKDMATPLGAKRWIRLESLQWVLKNGGRYCSNWKSILKARAAIVPWAELNWTITLKFYSKALSQLMDSYTYKMNR